jgi:DNA-directed RNA polymerase subunit RPC12/RpoP
MDNAYVRLVCPDCTKDWQTDPQSLPSHDEMYDCSECGTERRLAEFARTDHDLQTLKTL